MKICKKCEITQSIENFPDRKNNNGATIKHSWCRNCLKIKQQKYRKKNKNKVKEYDKKRYIKNRNDMSIIELEKDKLKKRNYYHKNKNNELFKEKRKLYFKEYYKDNKEKLLIQNKNNFYNKLKNDISFRLKHNISVNIRRSLKRKNHYKKSRTIEILGCSINEFKKYIESHWESWMNWDNYGLYNGKANYGWDLDHIIPTSSAINEAEVIKLNHYTNIQPLCSHVNRNIKKDIIS